MGAAAPASGLGFVSVEDVVLAVLYRFGAEEVGKLVALRVLVVPFTHRVVHVALDLDALVTEGRVVEGLEDVIDDFIHGDVGILPSKENTTIVFPR